MKNKYRTMKIKKLSEEIGYSYANKQEETDKDLKNKSKKQPKLGLLNNIVRPVAKSAFDAGKSGIDFETWWDEFSGSTGEEETSKKKIGFLEH